MRWFQLSPAMVTWRSRATLPSWFDLFRLDKIMILVIPIKTFFIITKITKMIFFIWRKITPIMLCPDFFWKLCNFWFHNVINRFISYFLSEVTSLFFISGELPVHPMHFNGGFWRYFVTKISYFHRKLTMNTSTSLNGNIIVT